MQYHFDHCSSFTGATQQEQCFFFIGLLDKDPTTMAWSSTLKASNGPALHRYSSLEVRLPGDGS